MNEKNEPKAYNQKNVPYKTTNYLKISLKGVKENDFAMVLGYPASTKQYVPSFGLEAIVEKTKCCKSSDTRRKVGYPETRDGGKILVKITLFYPNFFYFKFLFEMEREIQGVRRMNLVEEKKREEEAFQQWVEASPERKAKYGTVLEDMREVYKGFPSIIWLMIISRRPA